MSENESETADETIDASGKIVTPGWIDMHVHFREPGFEHKENIYSGSRAAAAGGITSVMAMPNLKPVPDNPETLANIYEIARKNSVVNYFQTASITVGENGAELTDFSSLKKAGAIAFTDDGKPVVHESMMLQAMQKAKDAGVLLSLHEEEEETLVKRDLRLLETVRTRLHFQHLSLHNSIDAVRRAKVQGWQVTCETAPHYFALAVNDVELKGTNAKMNPPLKTHQDRERVLWALEGGTIDVIATDHAPHMVAEKAQVFDKAPNGIIGLETLVGLCVTHLIDKRILTWPKLVEKVCVNPARILGLKNKGTLTVGSDADITIIDAEKDWIVDANKFFSKARNCPWDGEKLKGKTVATIVKGRVIFDGNNILR
ncbi:MAG: dihydroorotase [Candidatus Micrarchaeota archaeon]